MAECIPLHHTPGACGCGERHTPAEAEAASGDMIGFVCIRGGPPVRNRVICDVCGRDCAERSDGTVWKHEPTDSHGNQQRGRTCPGAFQPPRKTTEPAQMAGQQALPL
jgi:hypothetical protein